MTTPSVLLVCSNYVIESMEYAVGRMYVSKHFDIESKNLVRKKNFE